MNEAHQASQFLSEWEKCANNLTIAFTTDAKEEADRPTSTLQIRYVHACMAFANFLKSVGKDFEADKFHELAEALHDVSDGLNSSLFKVEKPSVRAGRKHDSSAVWRIRSNVVVALEMLIAGGMTEIEAISLAKKKYKALSKLLRPGTSFESSLANWRKTFAEKSAFNEMAQSTYEEGMGGITAARVVFSSEKIIGAGKTLLQKSAERSARLPI